MPSQPIDTGWGFNAVIDLIESDYDPASPTPSVASPVQTHVATLGPKSGPRRIAPPSLDAHVPRLGDFTKLFDELGISRPAPLAPASPVDSEGPISSDDALLSGQADAASIADPDSPLTAKEQKKERKRAAKKERKEARRALKASVPEECAPGTQPMNQPRPRSNVGAKIRPATPAPQETQPQAPKSQLPKRVLDFPQTPADPVSVSVTHPRLNLLAQPFAPASTPTSQPTLPYCSVDGFAKTPVKQVPSRPSLHETKSNPSVQLQIPSSVHFNRGLVPRTVQSVSASKEHNVSSGQAQSARTPVSVAAARFGTAAGQKAGVKTDLESTATPASQTPYQLQSPNRLATPVQIPFTPGGASTGLTIRSRTDRHFHFLNHLLANFSEDHQYLLAPMRLTTNQTMEQGIHCFVDASNIMIGFKNILRERGHYQPLDLSFDTLALLMERRRPVAKRIYASSQREANPLPHVTKLAETSKAVGYENLIQEQVFIRREDSDRKKFFKDVERVGWTKAMQLRAGLGSGSDSETGAAATPSAPKWVEQGVDEILHLKMCQSVLDTEAPTTMVLATGDGNAAEHSDGFLANVERALKKGWRVELVSWKQQMSAGYKNKKFRTKWGEQFRIVELDDYVESLIDT